jgi:hypothetical protein
MSHIKHSTKPYVLWISEGQGGLACIQGAHNFWGSLEVGGPRVGKLNVLIKTYTE